MTPAKASTNPDRYLPEEIFLPTYRALNMLAPPSWKFLLSLAAMKHNVMQRDILGPYKDHELVAARHEAIALTYQHTLLSTPAVGRNFNRDHSSVVHVLHKLDRRDKFVCRQEPSPALAARESKPAKPKAAKCATRPPTALQRAVRRAYENQIPPSVVAEEYGCAVGSVKVIAHYLGIKRSDFAPGVVAAE